MNTSVAHGAQINFEDLTPYLTYGQSVETGTYTDHNESQDIEGGGGVRVADPDPDESALILVAGSGSAFKLRIRIRIQESKNDKRKKCRISMF
jgi:hypothetical protein